MSTTQGSPRLTSRGAASGRAVTGASVVRAAVLLKPSSISSACADIPPTLCNHTQGESGGPRAPVRRILRWHPIGRTRGLLSTHHAHVAIHLNGYCVVVVLPRVSGGRGYKASTVTGRCASTLAAARARCGTGRAWWKFKVTSRNPAQTGTHAVAPLLVGPQTNYPLFGPRDLAGRCVGRFLGCEFTVKSPTTFRESLANAAERGAEQHDSSVAATAGTPATVAGGSARYSLTTNQPEHDTNTFVRESSGNHRSERAEARQRRKRSSSEIPRHRLRQSGGMGWHCSPVVVDGVWQWHIAYY